MTTVEQEMRQFLAQPENLRTAMQVSRHVAKLRSEAHRAFWPAFENKLRSLLVESSHGETWYVTQPSEHFRQAWVSCSLAPSLLLKYPNCTLLEVMCEQNSAGAGHRLYFGLRWTRNQDQPTNQPEYAALKAELVRQGRRLVENNWWVVLEHTGYAAAGDRFLIHMAEDQDSFVEEMANLSWSLFRETAELLNALNQAIVRGQIQARSELS